MPLSPKRTDTYFISAGERSGDLLGADLVLALREKLPKLAPFGVAGTAMVNAGVEEIASVSAFSVMGISDVARKLASLRMLETRLLAWIDRWEPRFAVLIDNPGFHIRFAEQLRMRGIRVFQYVAPKLWAWGESRAPRLRENYDLVLGILPFEEEFFLSHDINYQYVGSPLKDRIDKVIIKREALGLPLDRPVITCLPGSRPSEIQLNLPTIVGVRDAVVREMPNALFLVPVAANIEMSEVDAALSAGGGGGVLKAVPPVSGLVVESWEGKGLRFVRGMSLELMAAADVAVVASGTATLECALLGTPMVVVYTLSELSYQFAKRVAKVQYASLVNLIAGKGLVREFIHDFSLDDVSEEVLSLLREPLRRKAMRDAFEDIRDNLKGNAADNAAAAIAAYCETGRPVGTTF